MAIYVSIYENTWIILVLQFSLKTTQINTKTLL